MDHVFNSNLKVLSKFIESIHETQKHYVDTYTERLFLKKEATPDFVSTLYSIWLKDTMEKIGEVTLLFDGEIWYKIYPPHRNKGYVTEAVSELIDISNEKSFYLSIDFTNAASQKVARKLGFIYKKKIQNSLIFVYTKTNSKDSNI